MKRPITRSKATSKLQGSWSFATAGSGFNAVQRAETEGDTNGEERHLWTGSLSSAHWSVLLSVSGRQPSRIEAGGDVRSDAIRVIPAGSCTANTSWLFTMPESSYVPWR